MEAAARRLGVEERALEGKIAVVCGLGRGVASAVALELAALGASVVLSVDDEAGDEAARAIEDEGGQALYHPAESFNEKETEQLSRFVAESFGAADILVTDTSVAPVASVQEMSVSQWDETIGANLRSVFLLCKVFLPTMLERHSGTIVNNVSTEPVPFMSAYSASRLAVAAFTESLAAEVGPEGIRVVALVPGIVDTPGFRGVASKLPLRLGFEREDFLNMSRPATRAAEAVGYLLVQTADEYHGETVDGYRLLERAAAQKEAKDYARRHGLHLAEEPMETHARTEEFETALELVAGLEDILEETREFIARLPRYLRPFAGRQFSRRTGRSMADWQRLMIRLTVLLQRMESREEGAEIGYRHLHPTVREALARLSKYYHDAPDEAARIVRREAERHAVAEKAARNEAAIGSLIELMETIRR